MITTSSNARQDTSAPRLAFVPAVLLAVLILALKAPDALVFAQFWAQDGAVFFLAQHSHLAPRLFDVYAGNLDFLPRLIAWTATGFASVNAPLIYNASALALGAAGLASLRHLDRFAISFVVSLAGFALVPGNGEVLGNVTNLQWILQFYLISMFARLCSGEQDTMSPVLRVVIAVAVALTCQFSALAALIGLAIWLWLRSRDRTGIGADGRLAPATAEWSAFGCGAAIQAVTGWLPGDARSADASSRFDAYVIFVDSLPAHLFGAHVLTGTLLVALLVPMLWFVLRHADEREKAFIVALSLFVLLQLALVARQFSDRPGLFLSLQNGDRYFLLFKMSLWWLLAFAVAKRLPDHRSAAVGLVVFLLGMNAVSTSSVLDRPSLVDLHWREYAERIDAGQAVDVPINPVPWQFHVPASVRP